MNRSHILKIGIALFRPPSAAGKLLLALVLSGSATAQQSYTFTNAGATGPIGPTQVMVNNAYGSTNLSGAVTVLGQGIQQWTVPMTGAYSIRAIGASGGSTTANCLNSGGLGADMKGEFTLTQGQVLLILVGQMGSSSQNSEDGGGGGGTYVTSSSSVAMVVGGGGGGSTNNIGGCSGTQRDGLHASLTTAGTNGANGNGAGGTNGNGGTGSGGGAGGGLLTNGTGGGPTSFGLSFMNGGAGGTYNTAGPGGFGGGGSGYWEGGNGGGGGGYSGGGTNSGSPYAGGGGGGSYNSGANQVNVQASQSGHGRVIITRLCDVEVFASSNPMCEGSVVTLSTNAGSNIQWAHGPTAQAIQVSPQTTTSYTVSGVSSSTSACTSTVVITVTVNPLPNITALSFPPLVCAGNTGTLSASGALSYTWSNGPVGPATSVNPPATTVYTVTGESAAGCINTQTVELTVNTNEVTLAPTASVCAGKNATLVASGLTTYSWSTGSHFNALVVSPSTNSLYFVQGMDPFGCTLTGSVSLIVHNSPNVGINASKTQVCKGEPVTLEASGADQYQWSTNESTALITQVLNVDVPHHFTVSGTSSQGCTDTDVIVIQVSSCLSVGEERMSSVTLYPNPTTGVLRLSGVTASAAITVTDITGKTLMRITAESEQGVIDLTPYDAGIYFVTVSLNQARHVVKVIKE